MKIIVSVLNARPLILWLIDRCARCSLLYVSPTYFRPIRRYIRTQGLRATYRGLLKARGIPDDGQFALQMTAGAPPHALVKKQEIASGSNTSSSFCFFRQSEKF